MASLDLKRFLPFVRVAEPVSFPKGTGAGQRTAPRRDLRTEARVREVDGGGQALPLELAEVSATGAFIESPLLLSVGARVEIAFAMRENDDIVARARVVRVEDRAGRPGMGVWFERMPAEARAALRAYTQF